jgi:hypothetical protein
MTNNLTPAIMAHPLLTEAIVLPVDYCHYFHDLKRR